jgi:hypothetical protein
MRYLGFSGRAAHIACGWLDSTIRLGVDVAGYWVATWAASIDQVLGPAIPVTVKPSVF